MSNFRLFNQIREVGRFLDRIIFENWHITRIAWKRIF